MVDALKTNKRKRHGAAVKKGIKQAKVRKAVVKKASLALRAEKKSEIVQRLFKARTPPSPAVGSVGS